MPSHCTIETANHGQPHFHFRPRVIVRAAIIFVIAAGACLDVIGAYYAHRQQEALTRRVQAVSSRLIAPAVVRPVETRG